MKRLYLFACVLAACASMPRSKFIDHAVFEGFTVEHVREATRIVLKEVNRSKSDVWVTDDQVVTEGRIGACGRDAACGEGPSYLHVTGIDWATIKVRLRDLEKDTAVKVKIEYMSNSHCGDGYVPVSCAPEQLGSTGFLERRLIERIRARLEARDEVADMPSE